MDDWGTKMLATVSTVAEVVACGLGLPMDAFTSKMQMGPHLLAPTGSLVLHVCFLMHGWCTGYHWERLLYSALHAGTDLQSYGVLGSCYAGYHYDLNFLTIHGKSRFPGLAVWLQDGRRLPVSIPSGCLLIQAGKQIEWLTNGHVRAGMHEVSLFQPSGSYILYGHLAHLEVVLRQAIYDVLADRISLCCLEVLVVCSRWCAQRPPAQPSPESQLRANLCGGCLQLSLLT